MRAERERRASRVRTCFGDAEMKNGFDVVGVRCELRRHG
jgi:hypothetical protein